MEKIQEDIKEAMRAKDELRLTVLRNIKSEATNELVSTKRKPTDTLSDEELEKVISRLVKQRKDASEQFRNAGRDELADKEDAEHKILAEYLPQPLTDEELTQLIQTKKEELGVQDMSGMGQLIGAVMKEVGTRADGGRVKTIINTLLA